MLSGSQQTAKWKTGQPWASEQIDVGDISVKETRSTV